MLFKIVEGGHGVKGFLCVSGIDVDLTTEYHRFFHSEHGTFCKPVKVSV